MSMNDMSSVVSPFPRAARRRHTMYILVVGTPFHGMIPYGPFATEELAMAWGDRRFPVDEWHIVPLNETDTQTEMQSETQNDFGE